MSATNSPAAATGKDPHDRPDQPGQRPAAKSNKWVLWALLAVCVAPVIASYTAYYLMPPAGRTNYGALLQPQVDAKSVAIAPVLIPEPLPGLRKLPIAHGEPASLDGFGGRWVMVVPSNSACDEDCVERLYNIRQVRLTTGKHRDRVERLWLLTDQAAPDKSLLAEHDGMWVARINADELARIFPAHAGSSADQHIYMLDPLGHLMMRFPVNADPNRMKKDVLRLLKASRIG